MSSRTLVPPAVLNHQPSDLVWIIGRTAFDGLFVVDETRRYLYLNEPGARLLGAPEAEIVNRRIEDFTPSQLWPAVQRLWGEFKRRGVVQGRGEVLRADRSRALVEYRATRDLRPGEHLIAAREIAAPQVSVDGVRAEMRGEVAVLTPREQEVLQFAAYGRRTREIAELLNVSAGTIKTHFEHAYEKLGARDRAAAVAECLRRGLID
ncbi:MAG: two-component system, NarL family, nitrate/nitrite response regulator NarL [Solirubrobacteraceae bacterium]|jgi:two-component system nitrate/nitrite response regulator NarL|nr:two-component system, NarL family, nitrate/nitrite response regulator NarL [Solirubrobacteraceae bacterium]